MNKKPQNRRILGHKTHENQEKSHFKRHFNGKKALLRVSCEFDSRWECQKKEVLTMGKVLPFFVYASESLLLGASIKSGRIFLPLFEFTD